MTSIKIDTNGETEELSDKIVGATLRVQGEIGYGICEKTDERALVVAFGHLKIAHKQQN